MANRFSDQVLARSLALDVCEQWKRENGYKTMSPDDLAAVREWMSASWATISKFPGLQALAARGIDDLIARRHRANPAGAGPQIMGKPLFSSALILG